MDMSTCLISLHCVLVELKYPNESEWKLIGVRIMSQINTKFVVGALENTVNLYSHKLPFMFQNVQNYSSYGCCWNILNLAMSI